VPHPNVERERVNGRVSVSVKWCIYT
jgi:hypothetical protein